MSTSRAENPTSFSCVCTYVSPWPCARVFFWRVAHGFVGICRHPGHNQRILIGLPAYLRRLSGLRLGTVVGFHYAKLVGTVRVSREETEPAA